jgi:hypothetical protein
MAFDREAVKAAAAELAARGIYLGTSSWKYELCQDRHNLYFAEHRIMPSAGQDAAIGEEITSF